MIDIQSEDFENYLKQERRFLLARLDALEILLHEKRTSEIRAEWKEVMGAKKNKESSGQDS